jgi:hemerythrin-like domain-containing protein
MSTCDICIEKLNKSNRSPIECEFCSYIACKNCYKTYVLQQLKPNCMNCKKEWSLLKLVTDFTKSFMNNEYKMKRAELLFEREKELLPQTQNIIEQMNFKNKLKNQINDIDKQIEELKKQKLQLQQMLNENTLSTVNYIKECINKECRGYLNTEWECNLCKTKVCSSCNEIETTEHICDKNTVASKILIEQETRPCPRCKTRIYKINGCDQMWCTLCHTAFSWDSGRLETNIHNPHYYEYLKNQNQMQRNPLEIQCGREINSNLINRLSKLLRQIQMPKENINSIEFLCTNILHLQHIILPGLIRKIDNLRNNQNLRIKYLKHEISDEKFKSMLFRRDNELSIKQELVYILATYIHNITDIIYRYESDLTDSILEIEFIKQYKTLNLQGYLQGYQKEISELITYTNECFSIIYETYQCKNKNFISHDTAYIFLQ